MELYNPANASRDLERIKADVEPFYMERLANGEILEYTIHGYYKNMNLFYVWVDYVGAGDGEKFGTIRAHYTVLIINGQIKQQR